MIYLSLTYAGPSSKDVTPTVRPETLFLGKEVTDLILRCTEVPDALCRCPPHCRTALFSSSTDLIIRTISDVHHVRNDAVQMRPDNVPDGPPCYACLETLPSRWRGVVCPCIWYVFFSSVASSTHLWNPSPSAAGGSELLIWNMRRETLKQILVVWVSSLLPPSNSSHAVFLNSLQPRSCVRSCFSCIPPTELNPVKTESIQVSHLGPSSI